MRKTKKKDYAILNFMEDIKQFRLSKRDAILTVLALLTISWALYYFFTKPAGTVSAVHVTTTIGNYSPDFPPELKQFVFETIVQPKENVLTTFDGSTEKMWTVTYDSKMNAYGLLDQYKSNLSFMDWDITNYQPGDFIYATKNNLQLSVNTQNPPQVLISILQR